MKLPIYNKEGKEKGLFELPEGIFNFKWSPDLIHQVVVSISSNMRAGTAHTKTRSEVSGGGKKPWRQKGTGRARHGSSRSPIWAGGGVTFGPRNDKDYSKKINKKMRAKALFVALSQKVRDNEIILVDSFDIKDPKTKNAYTLLSNIAKAGFEKVDYKAGRRVLVVIPEKSEAVVKSFSNLKGAKVDTGSNLGVYDVMKYKYVMIENPERTLELLADRAGSVKEKKSKETVKTSSAKKATVVKTPSAKATAVK